MLLPTCPTPGAQDAGAKAAAAVTGSEAAGTFLQLRDGRFVDDRWVGGRWDLSCFKKADGETNWDAVRLLRLFDDHHHHCNHQ